MQPQPEEREHRCIPAKPRFLPLSKEKLWRGWGGVMVFHSGIR
ncbi:predicted protein [Plenodomus lingam JN3]|uniref:Predicted protein n=1 Tax=Leptosphaeria maculans (strain JN3 / isolate v23.1.3 / race Av1-4-5-6-7-8) TaxID=985895 RepID=E4ZVK0_LEPMJ|nr:predicted protein [Plenodomus lingam JN3]CBX95626.1 predicted protein [Plenodomus lingam JN3]